MKQEYTELLPKWVNTNDLDLVLSDDIDSLTSCALLEKEKGWNIRYFYDFGHMYFSKELLKTYKKLGLNKQCYIDVAVKKGYAIDNHVSNLKQDDLWNQDMININTFGNSSNQCYTNKYSGSTLLEVWSILNYPLPETEEGKMILLAIDSSFLGFYSNKFHDTQHHYLVNILGFEELYEVIQRHEKTDFDCIINKYHLKQKIRFDNKRLKTELDLPTIGKLLGIEITLPSGEFICYRDFEVKECNVQQYQETKVFSLAFTYRNKMRYCKEIEKIA